MRLHYRNPSTRVQISMSTQFIPCIILKGFVANMSLLTQHFNKCRTARGKIRTALLARIHVFGMRHCVDGGIDSDVAENRNAFIFKSQAVQKMMPQRSFEMSKLLIQKHSDTSENLNPKV